MQIITKEISEEEYIFLSSQENVSKAIEAKMPISILCGYGYYGGYLTKSNDKFYMNYKIGSHCD